MQDPGELHKFTRRYKAELVVPSFGLEYLLRCLSSTTHGIGADSSYRRHLLAVVLEPRAAGTELKPP